MSLWTSTSLPVWRSSLTSSQPEKVQIGVMGRHHGIVFQNPPKFRLSSVAPRFQLWLSRELPSSLELPAAQWCRHCDPRRVYYPACWWLSNWRNHNIKLSKKDNSIPNILRKCTFIVTLFLSAACRDDWRVGMTAWLGGIGTPRIPSVLHEQCLKFMSIPMIHVWYFIHSFSRLGTCGSLKSDCVQTQNVSRFKFSLCSWFTRP